MRGGPLGTALVLKLLQRLTSSGPMTKAAVESFLSVVAEDSDLSAENHHRVLPFHRQKFFTQTAPKLLEFYFSGENESSSVSGGGADLVLDAVLRQLPGVPAAAVEETMAPHVQKIASRMFTKSKESDQVSVSPAMLSFLDFYSSRLDHSV